MKIEIDKEKCVACGLCQILCPEVFEIQNDNSIIKKDADFLKNKNCIEEAAANCPMSAITIKKED